MSNSLEQKAELKFREIVTKAFGFNSYEEYEEDKKRTLLQFNEYKMNDNINDVRKEAYKSVLRFKIKSAKQQIISMHNDNSVESKRIISVLIKEIAILTQSIKI